MIAGEVYNPPSLPLPGAPAMSIGFKSEEIQLQKLRESRLTEEFLGFLEINFGSISVLAQEVQ